ncbi:polysaccharide deacetylase family protein [Actomonas aquatica]|uniref:Polysaccharide deacetylase family protein n=1 Tax=Actomonas aquatica TaxID=2866162 RepID=A0ABZ1C5X7_9BACT|nr:polysaccharide deacetylase family protein [Opitutus sp. WL0086]WRQ85929.1 polysaccharide deacetylase family protein [Opitutus sp. WL0086]
MTRFRHLLLALTVVALARAESVEEAVAPEGFHWPHGAQAAVCLTYDDSLASQLDVAFPQLEAMGLKGTFFLMGNGGTMVDRVEDWRAVAAAGHELGSHSLFHPCRRGLPNRDWVSVTHDLDVYTLDRLEKELLITDTLLHAIDGETERTFAYPCGETVVEHGEVSFLPVTRKLFIASRGVDPTIMAPRDLKFSNTPAFDPSHGDLQATIDYLEACAEAGTVAVFLMHGVEGDYLETPEGLHQQILDYLVAHKDRFWVDTFKNVMTHAQGEFERLGWPVE